jgi:heme exporter protein A
VLKVHQATFARSGEAVFAPVDLALAAGEALIVLGPNGCGKTTLLRMLAGILRPWQGKVVRHCQPAFLGHLPAFKGDLSCRENLAFQRRFHNGAGLDENRALARVGLAGLGLRPARTLSAGQKRRLGLAGLLVAPRPLWLLDEPYASLDDADANWSTDCWPSTSPAAVPWPCRPTSASRWSKSTWSGWNWPQRRPPHDRAQHECTHCPRSAPGQSVTAANR